MRKSQESKIFMRTKIVKQEKIFTHESSDIMKVIKRTKKFKKEKKENIFPKQ
jgi:hypothetical protein